MFEGIKDTTPSREIEAYFRSYFRVVLAEETVLPCTNADLSRPEIPEAVKDQIKIFEELRLLDKSEKAEIAGFTDALRDYGRLPVREALGEES